jgi:hypothetical protein
MMRILGGEEDNVEVRSPLIELAHPILESCFGDDN